MLGKAIAQLRTRQREIDASIEEHKLLLKNKWQAPPRYHQDTYEVNIERVNEQLMDQELQVCLSPDADLAKVALRSAFEIGPAEEGLEPVKDTVSVKGHIARKFRCPKLCRKLKRRSLQLTISESWSDRAKSCVVAFAAPESWRPTHFL